MPEPESHRLRDRTQRVFARAERDTRGVRRWSRRRLAIAAAALAVVALGAAYGAFVLIAGGSEPRLQPLLAGGASTDGTWAALAAPPTAVGYRVREKLVGVPAPHDAVGRTSAVRGTLEIRDGRIEALRLDVDLSTLRSDRSERDQVLLDEGPQFRRYPRGRFVLHGVAGRSPAAGDLTLHGVTRHVDVPFTVAARGDRLEVVGAFRIRFADYGFAPPSRPIVTIDRSGTIEFRIRFRRASH
jgi:polyisoprenoid-binding protein YceI